jgi:hypothetical protein
MAELRQAIRADRFDAFRQAFYEGRRGPVA